MTPDQIQQVRDIIRDEFQEFLASDRYIFHKKVQFLDGRSVQLGKTNGTKIGTETTQKLGFFNKTPVVQAGAIASPTGGAVIDTQARTAIDAIRTVLTNLGLTA